MGILHFSSACPTTFLRRKSSDKQYQFLHTRSIHNNLNCVLHFFNNEQGTRFLMKFVCAKTISRPKNPIMAAYGPDPQKPICFFRVPTVTFFLWFNYGFLKAGVLFKIQKYGFRTGSIPGKYGNMLGSPCFQHPKGTGITCKKLNKLYTGCPICHLPASKPKGLNSNKRLHFPTRRSKARIHIGFQVPKAAAFYANPEP